MKYIMFLFIIISNVYSQDRFYNGIGIELGLGHNQLMWSVKNGQSGDRSNFYLKPSVRLSYYKNIYKNISVQPFVGFIQFGGRSDTDTNGYKDKYTFDCIDFGFNVDYPINSIVFGFGIKANHHLNVTNRSYGNLLDDPNDRHWQNSDMSFIFRKWSSDLGIRIGYKFIDHFSVYFESWFGITDLAKSKWNGLYIHQNNYRLLIGYRL
jgi:hypothetical protein